MNTRTYTIESDVLWHNGRRYSNGEQLTLTAREARWLLGQHKIKPVTRKRKAEPTTNEEK